MSSYWLLGSALRWIATLTVLATLASGCVDEFDPASVIERTRVVGARVEVAGEPERATPRPGETATVSWMIVAPEELPPMAWAFALCGSEQSGNSGPPVAACPSGPLATYSGAGGAPRLDITVPPAEQLGNTATLILIGQICAGSEPVLPTGAELPGCTVPGTGTTVTLRIPLERSDAERNLNPAIGTAPLWFDGAGWPASATGADCTGLPIVAAGTNDHVLRLRIGAADRELFTTLEGDPPVPTETREVLQLSHFATGGRLERTFSFIEAADERAEPEIEVKWDAPPAAEVPAGGRRVQILFVARDLRGGADSVTREVCVQ